MINLPKKNIPKPSNPLKSLNWSKLPDLKVKDTIWMGVDDSRVGVVQLEWVWCNMSGCGLQVLVWCSVESEWLWSTSISVVLCSEVWSEWVWQGVVWSHAVGWGYC